MFQPGKKMQKADFFRNDTLMYPESKTSKAREAQGELKIWRQKSKMAANFIRARVSLLLVIIQ